MSEPVGGVRTSISLRVLTQHIDQDLAGLGIVLGRGAAHAECCALAVRLATFGRHPWGVR